MIPTGMTPKPIIMNEDNQSAMSLAKNPQFHGLTKHINIKFHYLRELVEQNMIELSYCPSDIMVAGCRLSDQRTCQRQILQEQMTGLKKLI
jgi:hypothetical protein